MYVDLICTPEGYKLTNRARNKLTLPSQLTTIIQLFKYVLFNSFLKKSFLNMCAMKFFSDVHKLRYNPPPFQGSHHPFPSLPSCTPPPH